MILNRSIQVSLVKPEVVEGLEAETATNAADMAYILHATGESLIKGAGALMLTYMAADTFRQAAVHIVKTKIK